MSINPRPEADLPTLESFFNTRWEGDIPEDVDYLQAESNDGSSDEWEGVTESTLGSDDDEDRDNDMNSEDSDSEGYDLNALCYALLISLSRQELTLTEDQVNMLEKRVAEFRLAELHRRTAIIKDCLNWIEQRWHSNTAFNRKKVETVCAFSLYVGWASLIPSSLFTGTYIVTADRQQRNRRSTSVVSGRSMMS